MKRIWIAGVTVAAVAAHARAQCPAIDFENLAAGAAVTDQYAGVTFSVVPQSCANSPTLYMRIASGLAGGTSSGSKALKIELPPCGPGFSDEYVRMVFDDLQSEVSFILGDWATTYAVRAYSTSSGGLGLLSSASVVIEGVGTVGVHRFVRVTNAAGSIRRIEIEAAASNFEAIDDLAFGQDTTPPIAEIQVPTYEACSCGVIQVRGRACDPDGAYDFDKLEYQRVDAAVGAAWTQVGMFSVPQCTPNGLLYSWNTAPAAITDGFYYLRLTVVNECGLTTTDQTVAYVDKSFSLLPAHVRSPAAGAIVGGVVCFDGTVWDFCPGTYTAKYSEAGAGVFSEVDPLNLIYATWVVNDPFASWNTEVGLAAVADGDYDIEVRGTDGCGNTAAVTRTITIDNTAPTALITSPVSCTYRCGVIAVNGTADDANLQSWVLEYTGGDAHGWVLIEEGVGPVVAGLLANWDTAGLALCDYTLRLRVYDEAVIDCGPWNNVSEYTVSLHLGAYADCNRSGTLTAADFTCFQGQFVAGCP